MTPSHAFDPHCRVHRRTFLSSCAAAACTPFIHSAPLFSGKAAADDSGASFRPDYRQLLSEILLVYDQVAADYHFGEIASLIHALPPLSSVVVLCSESRREEAKKQLGGFGNNVRIIQSEGKNLWGDWGRDIFHIGWKKGKRHLLVPYTKTALTRGKLTRGYDVLRVLASEKYAVELVPLSFEGGNMAYDIVDGQRTLFAGSSVLIDSIALYKRWFQKELEPEAVITMLRQHFNVDRVIPLGRKRNGRPLKQADLLFHIDLAFSLVGPKQAAIQSFELPSEEELKNDLSIEAEGRSTTYSSDKTVHTEMKRLREAHEELQAVREQLRGLKYTIHPLRTSWRRIRRTQSYANILISGDRLIMPVFPRPGSAQSRIVYNSDGRHVVHILKPPRAKDYRMTGSNLACYRTYKAIRKQVTVIQDAFYLAGGNIHCVIGSLG